MRLYLRSLVYKEAIVGIAVNWCKTLKVFRSIESVMINLKESGHSLLIGSMFKRVEFIDSVGKRGLFPDDKNWKDTTKERLRALLRSGIEFEIIGNKEELDFLKENDWNLYNEISSHIIWKGIKNGDRKNKRDIKK